MTDRDKRLQSFLAGDLADAQKALTLAQSSDQLTQSQKVIISSALSQVNEVIRKRMIDHETKLRETA